MNEATLPAIEDLPNCRLSELQGFYVQIVGEPTRCPNRKFLIRRITETLEEQAAREQAASTATSHESESLALEKPSSDKARDTEDNEGTAAALAEQDSDEELDKPLSKLSIEELQQRYLATVGRPTGSVHRRYLTWKIRQAEKGKIPTGPRNRRSPGEPTPEFKILPIRMEADLVERIDQARERLGHESRMALFRNALNAYFNLRGETELAAFFAPRG